MCTTQHAESAVHKLLRNQDRRRNKYLKTSEIEVRPDELNKGNAVHSKAVCFSR